MVIILTNLSAAAIAAAFGGAERAANGWICCCPAHSDTKPSLSLREVVRGCIRCHCFAGCSSGRLRRECERRGFRTSNDQGDQSDQSARKQAPSRRNASKASSFGRLLRVWDQSRAVVIGDPVDAYLRGRGIALSTYPAMLRYHPALEYWQATAGGSPESLGTFPAMVAAVQGPDGGLVSLHRTFLADGAKAVVPSPKKLMSSIYAGATTGAAVRLCAESETLAVAEGIETALAVHAVTELSVWSTISAGGMKQLELPSAVREVIICADLDKSGAGQAAALFLAGRMIQQGRKVKIALPEVEIDGKGVDWADLLSGDCDNE